MLRDAFATRSRHCQAVQSENWEIGWGDERNGLNGWIALNFFIFWRTADSRTGTRSIILDSSSHPPTALIHCSAFSFFSLSLCRIVDEYHEITRPQFNGFIFRFFFFFTLRLVWRWFLQLWKTLIYNSRSSSWILLHNKRLDEQWQVDRQSRAVEIMTHPAHCRLCVWVVRTC